MQSCSDTRLLGREALNFRIVVSGDTTYLDLRRALSDDVFPCHAVAHESRRHVAEGGERARTYLERGYICTRIDGVFLFRAIDIELYERQGELERAFVERKEDEKKTPVVVAEVAIAAAIHVRKMREHVVKT